MKLYYLEKKNIIIIIIILSISNKVSWRATKVYKPSHQYLPKCRVLDTCRVSNASSGTDHWTQATPVVESYKRPQTALLTPTSLGREYIHIYDALMQSKPSCIERVWNFCFANCLSPIEELRTRWSQTGSHHTNAKAKTKFCDQMNIWKTNNLNSPNCLCNTHIA